MKADCIAGREKPSQTLSALFPLPNFDLAQQLLKDPYNFDFLTLSTDAQECDMERGLLLHLRSFLLEVGIPICRQARQVYPELHLRSFLLEVGIGFSFVGSGYQKR